MQRSISKIRYSVVIIVRNDRGVETSLSALDKIVATNQDVEVVVVDASLPETLRDIKDKFAWAHWYYFTNTTGKRFTIPEQRNVGINHAAGSVVIFLDSDCKPSRTWFSAVKSSFETDGYDAVTGPIRSMNAKTTHDVGYEQYKDGQPIVESGAANLAVRKDILEELRGFDDNMSYGEDVDLAWRMRDAGYELIFKKKMVIRFDWGDSRLERKRAFRYGTARMMLYKKHPSHWRNLFSQDINFLIYPLFIVLLPVSWWLPVYPLLLLVPIMRNRRHKPIQTIMLHLIYAAGVLKGLFRSVG